MSNDPLQRGVCTIKESLRSFESYMPHARHSQENLPSMSSAAALLLQGVPFLSLRVLESSWPFGHIREST